MHRVDGRLTSRPFRPRIAARLDLSDVVVIGTRPAKSTEFWWFQSNTVLLAESRSMGSVEMGFGLEDWVPIAEEVISYGR